MMKVFLSYAVGPLDVAVAARLRAVSAAYDVSILLPDRTIAVSAELPADTVKKIQQSDAVIGLLTRTAQINSIQVVNAELKTAAEASKPIIALVEQGVPVQGISMAQVVYFDPQRPTAHEADLMNALELIRKQRWKSDLTALGWIAGIALGLIALNELLSDKK